MRTFLKVLVILALGILAAFAANLAVFYIGSNSLVLVIFVASLFLAGLASTVFRGVGYIRDGGRWNTKWTPWATFAMGISIALALLLGPQLVFQRILWTLFAIVCISGLGLLAESVV